MSRRYIMAWMAAAALGWSAAPVHAFFFSRSSVRTTVQRLVEALENENLEAVKACISPRFLAGNPEIPGRLDDAFEKFDATRISYKIASIREADGIAAVKLNWTKTTTNPMNNWTYRDIGNDVVMYFNAESPHQLVGLEDGSLFGISFLLATRIVIPAPDEKRLEVARKELEVTERQAALAREQAEREAAKAEVRRKEQELENARRQAREEADQKARAEKQKADDARKAQEQESRAQTTAARKTPQAGPPMPGSDLTPEEMARLVALEATIQDAVGAIPGRPATSADPGLGQAVRDKAEEEARRMLRATPGVPGQPPSASDGAPPAMTPELERWRQDRLREIRTAQAGLFTPAPLVDTADSPESLKTLRDIEESARLQAELKEKTNLKAIQMLAEQRAREKTDTPATPPGDTPAPPPDVATATAPRVESRERDLMLAKEEAQARAKAVLEEIARLQQETPSAEPESDMAQAVRAAREEARRRAEEEQAEQREVRDRPAPAPAPEPAVVDPATLEKIEEEARLQAAIKAKAEEDAKALALRRQLDTLTNVSAEALARLTRDTAVPTPSESSTVAPVPPAVPAPTPEQLAEAVRRKAEEDARTLQPPLPPPPLPPTPPVTPPASVSTPTSQPPATVESSPVPKPGTTEPAQPRPTPAAGVSRDPLGLDLALVRGGEQPGGPHHDFRLARYEVTNDEFAEFLNNARANPYNGRGSSMFFDDVGNVYMDASTNLAKRLFAMTDLDFGGSQKGMVFEDGQYRAAPGMGRHPVVGVSWYGALKYCNWLTIHSGLGEDACAYTEGPDPEKWHPSTLTDEEWLNGFSDIERQAWLDAGVGYRLPMNSYNTTTGRFNEFYAAAAWDGAANRVFGFGRDTLTGRDANFARAGTPFEGGTTPVGYFDGSDHGGAFATNPNQNRNGIHDLSGNAWEWSNDTTGHPDYRALFGGAFDGDEDSLKTTFRGSLNPYRVCDNVGFRVAITPTQPKRPAAPPPRPAL